MMMDPNTTVFVVDDEEAVRQSLKWLVGSIKLKVATFPSAEAFLRNYRPETPGCIVLDVRMPEMSGIELMDRLHEHGISIPIIFLSAHGDVPMAVRAMKAGAIDFLQKPFNSQEFLDRVNVALKIDAEARERRRTGERLVKNLSALTLREREILRLALSGEGSKRIAKRLNISLRTVEVHRAHIVKSLAFVPSESCSRPLWRTPGGRRDWGRLRPANRSLAQTNRSKQR
jgi:FixJ family two-component response regulator